MPRNLLNKLVKISKAAEILGISIDTLRRWDKKGIIKSQRPTGRERYYSIKEIEKVKFSKPLTISQAAKVFDLPPSTLRRLDKKGLVKPEKTKSGERLYSKKSLEKYLDSQYFLSKKEAQGELLKQIDSSSGGKNSKKTEKIAEDILLLEQEKKLHRLQMFCRTFFAISGFIAFASIILIFILTYLWVKYPEKTAQYLGYRAKPSSSYEISQVLGAQASDTDQVVQTSAQIVSFLSPQPHKSISYEIAKQINPIVARYAPKGTRVIDSIFVDVNENLNITKPLLVKNGQIKFLSNEQVDNLNAQYIQGKEPGSEEGNLVVLGENGIVQGLRIEQINLADGSVVGGVGGVILDGSILGADLADGIIDSSKLASDFAATPYDNSVTSAKIAAGAVGTSDIADGAVTGSKIADGTITDGKLAQITTSNKVAGSAVQLATGGGLINNSGLSLLTSCSSSEILIWSGTVWACGSSSSSGVSSLNSLTGVLTIAGAGINTVVAAGS